MAEADAGIKAASERLGTSLGEWRLEDLLGYGGMASVYSARSSSGARAAIKVLHKELSSGEVRRRFMQEGAAATRVGHPGVVAVLGNGETADGTCYLILELLEGEPLGRALKRGETLTIARILDVLDQILDVLAVAHEKGIIHRDLKPDNLFVASDGRIKVLDFGIARMLDDVPDVNHTRAGTTLGTVPYMSPEQATGKRDQLDGRADLFSLGAMTFRLLAKRSVHQANTDADILLAMATKPAPPLLSVAPEAPPDLAAIVDVALAFSRDSRYPDARTMQADVRAVRAGAPPPFATRVARARAMSTRVDIDVPTSSAQAKILAARRSSSPPAAAADVFAHTERGAPPAWNARDGAPTVARAVHSAPTAVTNARPDLLADGPTLQSAPPPSAVPASAAPPTLAAASSARGRTAVMPAPGSPSFTPPSGFVPPVPRAAPPVTPARKSRTGLFVGAAVLALGSAAGGFLLSEAREAAVAASSASSTPPPASAPTAVAATAPAATPTTTAEAAPGSVAPHVPAAHLHSSKPAGLTSAVAASAAPPLASAPPMVGAVPAPPPAASPSASAHPATGVPAFRPGTHARHSL